MSDLGPYYDVDDYNPDVPDCPRGCESWGECDEMQPGGPDCSSLNLPRDVERAGGSRERTGFGVCRTGRCIEPCGDHGGCKR